MSNPGDFDRWRPHPWHGLSAGREPPRILNAYVEITPFDTVKYEIDKETGYLRVDRPQRTSSLPPTLYGFVPRTLCGECVAALAGAVRADGDPLDICILSERPINRAEIVLSVRVVGGISLMDDGAADDKIIAVLENDAAWGQANDLGDLPHPLIERLQHYFSTYKSVPGEPAHIKVHGVYDLSHALKVVVAALEDYQMIYGRGR